MEKPGLKGPMNSPPRFKARGGDFAKPARREAVPSRRFGRFPAEYYPAEAERESPENAIMTNGA
jgi:hypothetical protein